MSATLNISVSPKMPKWHHLVLVRETYWRSYFIKENVRTVFFFFFFFFFVTPKICIWQPDYERNKSCTAVVGQFQINKLDIFLGIFLENNKIMHN